MIAIEILTFHRRVVYSKKPLSMSAFGGGGDDISTLSSLLSESRAAQEENEKYYQPPTSVAPSTVVIGGQGNSKKDQHNAKPKGSDPKDIWTEEEILPEDALQVDLRAGRTAPRYEFSYKQSVGTEDTFLGLGDKTPLSSDCTHLVVKIHFPGSSMKQLDLDVTKKRIRASSKTHYLFTYLPVEVDDENGSAKFDPKKEVLTITLPIVPEF